MNVSRGEVRKAMVNLILEVTQPAYENLLRAAPFRELYPKELEAIGWITIKHAFYSREADPTFDFGEAEKRGHAILLASRALQPTQFIPDSQACGYLEQRLGLNSTAFSIEIEAMAEKLFVNWSLEKN